MKVSLTVEFQDGTKQDVDAIFADFLAFEKGRGKSVVRLEVDMQLTDLGYLAWTALKREGKTTLKFDPDWVTTVAMVTAREETATAPLES